MFSVIQNSLTDADRAAAIQKITYVNVGGKDFKISAESVDQPTGPFLRVDFKNKGGDEIHQWVQFINGVPVVKSTDEEIINSLLISENKKRESDLDYLSDIRTVAMGCALLIWCVSTGIVIWTLVGKNPPPGYSYALVFVNAFLPAVVGQVFRKK